MTGWTDAARAIETRMTGGHPNSLGHTIEVVDLVLADRTRHEGLFQCYFSDDEVVLHNSMIVLTDWSAEDEALQNWLRPHLQRLTGDHRKSVAARARKMLAKLS